MLITMLWHVVDEFYNVRAKKGMKTFSVSIMKMRHKIYNVVDVNWKYHVILTLDKENEKKYKNKIDSTLLRTFLIKVKKIFPETMHFWKYEEGRQSERPHFHLLFDLKESAKDKFKEIMNVVNIDNLDLFIENQKGYAMNKHKSNLELLMGYFMFKLWNKGITHVRHIKNEAELHLQVELDVAKRTGTEGFKANKQKYGFSRGLKVGKIVRKREYEWAGNCSINDAFCYLEETKDNFIQHFDKGDYSGEIIYEYTIEDLKKLEKEEKKIANEDKKQTELRIFE